MTDIPLEFEQRSFFDEQYVPKLVGKVKVIQDLPERREFLAIIECDGKYLYYHMWRHKYIPKQTPFVFFEEAASENMKKIIMGMPKKYRDAPEQTALHHCIYGPFENPDDLEISF